MHIVLVPSWYATAANPVRGNFFLNEAVALQKAGHKVGMIVPPSKFRTLHGLRETLAHWRQPANDIEITEDRGIPLYRIPWWGWNGLLNLNQRALLAAKIFDRYCAHHGKPDIIHGQAALYGGYLAARIGEARGIPSVFTEHATIYLRGRVFPDQGAAVSYTIRHCDKTLVTAPALAKALQKYAPEKTGDIEALGNMVNTGFFTAALVPPPDEVFVFLMVASLTPRKAHDVLLSAFAQAFRGEPVRLRIAGTGYEGRRLARLRKRIAELDIENQVELLGIALGEKLRHLMQTCHVVVSSSHVETFGVTLIEAMSCGKPVVATASGGPEFFVNETNGLLVPPRDPDAFARAMQQLKENYARYDPLQIRAACVARFSEAAITRRLEAIYQSLIR
jgi:glycosyltransferase involved in cell wall biosynthesis